MTADRQGVGRTVKLSAAARATLSNLSTTDEAIRRGSGILATFEADCKTVGYATDVEVLAKRKLCRIEMIGETQFAKITPAGQAALTGQSP